MFLLIKLLAIVSFLNSCSSYTSLYKENLSVLNELRNIALITDKKKTSESIKKQLLEFFPPKNNIFFIVEIVSTKSTTSTVSNIDTKISGYEIEIVAEIKIYKRNYEKDVMVYSFLEKETAPYNLTTNKVLSALANRNNAEYLVIKKLSKNIYDRILIFMIKNKKNVS